MSWKIKSAKNPDLASVKTFRELDVPGQVSNLHQRAESLEVRQQKKALKILLDTKPELLAGIIRHLKSKGVELPSVKRLGKSLDKDEHDEDVGEGEDEMDCKESPAKVRRTSQVIDDDPKNWLPHKYTRLDNTTAPTLEMLAAALQPISYSPYMLKALKTNVSGEGARA